MRRLQGILGIVAGIILGIVPWSMADVSIFNTGEVAGFYNLVFKINPIGRGKTHAERELIKYLWRNRSLSGDNVRINEKEDDGEVGAEIDRRFMVHYLRSRLRMIEDIEDIFDPIGDPGDGYEYDMHIVHPGSEPGVLEGGPYPIIIMCQGFTGGAVGWEDSYNWIATYYANKGYVFAMPRFFENFSKDPRTGESNIPDIATFMQTLSDIASIQVSDAIDYLISHFGDGVYRRNVTAIGHSNGGYIAILAAAKDSRIDRVAFLSSVFKLYGTWDDSEADGNYLNVIDSYDIFRYLNFKKTWCPCWDAPSLHVQRGISNSEGCPPGLPCDPIVDMFTIPSPYDLSKDPWLSFDGCEGPCVDKTLTFYNWAIYEGPKEEGVKDNPYTDHGFGGEEGREEALRLLDDFFDNFPLPR